MRHGEIRVVSNPCIRPSQRATVGCGELPPVPADVAREIGKLRELIANDLGLLESNDTQQHSIDTTYGLSINYQISDYPINEHGLGMLSEEMVNIWRKNLVVYQQIATLLLNQETSAIIVQFLRHKN